MLKELVEKIKKMSRERVPFDASKFNDPIASQTDWSPLKGGGANFKLIILFKLITIGLSTNLQPVQRYSIVFFFLLD